MIVGNNAAGRFLVEESIIKKAMSITDYLRETKVELKHVTWPTRGQAIAFTIIVILISVGVAAFLGFFDFIFSTILSKFILR